MGREEANSTYLCASGPAKPGAQARETRQGKSPPGTEEKEPGRRPSEGSLRAASMLDLLLIDSAKFPALSVSNFAFGEGFSNLSNPTHKHLSLYPLRLKVLDFQL